MGLDDIERTVVSEHVDRPPEQLAAEFAGDGATSA
jgi:hypothetical protein